MPLARLREFLDEHGVKYTVLIHSAAYTAQETAQSAHIPGKELAKTVMVKLDGRIVMAVLPALYQVDLEALGKAAYAEIAELAEESEFRGIFPDCEPGAMPPFGNLYNLPVFVAEELALDEEIAFNAGSHSELVRLAYDDFARLVKPLVRNFSRRDRAPRQPQ